MCESNIFDKPIKVVNIGTELLGEALKEQKVDTIQLDWKPPIEVKLSPRIREILEKME